MDDLSGKTTLVVGASRGLGRGIATAAAEAGASVIAVARSAMTFPEPATGAGSIQAVIADAADASVPGSLLDRYDPEVLVLVAGASPLPRRQSWARRSDAAWANGRRALAGCDAPADDRRVP